MSQSQGQSQEVEGARGAGTSYGPQDTTSSDQATPEMSVGSTTVAGHGSYPTGDDPDVSNVSLPNSRVGPQQEDLDGEQIRPPGEGDVMAAQFNKEGQGEEPSLTSDLDRKKAEQQSARDEIKEARERGEDID